MNEMLGFVIYWIGVCLFLPLCIGAVLYILWKKDDDVYSNEMNIENNKMQYKKTMLAMYIAILFSGIAFIFIPMTIPGEKNNFIAYMVFFMLSCIFTIPISISIYSITKWQVVIVGENIEVNVPRRKKLTFMFDDIIYATETYDSDYIQNYAKYHIYIKDSQENTIKAFSLNKSIHGYEIFAKRLKDSGKINEKESRIDKIAATHKLIFWCIIIFAILLVIPSVFFLINDINNLYYIEHKKEEIIGTIIFTTISISMFPVAVIINKRGKAKIKKLRNAEE
ncbi:MAG: hypothetical protein LBC73_08605 [Oscillospiraceae bacterium]|jgi:hypothetical protein|nr:hypothetical protein [Oscillospiraceae bacterium]